MKIKTLNIKQDFPPADVAVANMEIEIEALTGSEIKAIKIIHGYGSHGVGGEIKRQLIKRLSELKKQGKVLDFVQGEKFGQEQKSSAYILKKYPELILDEDFKNYNSGITLVFLNDKQWMKWLFLYLQLKILSCIVL